MSGSQVTDRDVKFSRSDIKQVVAAEVAIICGAGTQKVKHNQRSCVVALSKARPGWWNYFSKEKWAKRNECQAAIDSVNAIYTILGKDKSEDQPKPGYLSRLWNSWNVFGREPVRVHANVSNTDPCDLDAAVLKKLKNIDGDNGVACGVKNFVNNGADVNDEIDLRTTKNLISRLKKVSPRNNRNENSKEYQDASAAYEKLDALVACVQKYYGVDKSVPEVLNTIGSYLIEKKLKGDGCKDNYVYARGHFQSILLSVLTNMPIILRSRYQYLLKNKVRHAVSKSKYDEIFDTFGANTLLSSRKDEIDNDKDLARIDACFSKPDSYLFDPNVECDSVKLNDGYKVYAHGSRSGGMYCRVGYEDLSKITNAQALR